MSTLSIDRRLDGALLEHGMPVAEFAICAKKCGIEKASKSRLFQAFREELALENDVALKLWSLWQEIEEMAKSFEPFKLDLSCGSLVCDWLQARRAGEVYAVVISSGYCEPTETVQK